MKFVCDFKKADKLPIGNRFSNLSFWFSGGTVSDERMWQEWAEAMPEGWLKKNYPWLEEMQIFVASGGSYIGYPRQLGDTAICEFTRDLFKNPADRSMLDDYDFEPLVRTCRNMLRQGVRPCLKLHAVPVKYSSKPKIGWFRVNSRPPDDYEVYAAYISALVQAMVDEFGKKEVCCWRWFVGTEMENPVWWEAPEETGEANLKEYLKFHDWSVFALERVLGAECGSIGAHAMMTGGMTGGLWDPEEFMKHCAGGKNYATGEKGSRLDFFAISYYDRAPGFIESDEWQTNLTGDGARLALFENFAGNTRAALNRCGYEKMPIEVSEGGMLFGMDGKWMWNGLAPGGVFDATWTAWAFWKMLENNVALWSRWGILRTRGLFRGPEAAVTHAMRMLTALKDSYRISVTQDVSENMIRVVAGISSAKNKVQVLIFHHAPDVTKPAVPAAVELKLENLPYAGTVKISRCTLDSEHGDFWPQWEKDRAMLGLTDKDYFRSREQIDVNHALINPHHKAVWEHYEKLYEPLSAFPEAEISSADVNNETLVLSCVMPCFSITLFEIEGV